ncbi:19647_t:CDS:1, partial [Racocetra fulgida]
QIIGIYNVGANLASIAKAIDYICAIVFKFLDLVKEQKNIETASHLGRPSILTNKDKQNFLNATINVNYN